jgi:hypothetical protein
VAGKIQGLLTGDFGSLGKASFTEKQVSSLLQLAIDDIKKIVSMKESTSASHRRKKGRHAVWRELLYRQRQHLELVARLMACAQRLYLSRVEWALLDDQNEELTNMLGSYDGPGDDWIEPKLPGKVPCPVEEFAASPWVEYVIRNLYEAAPQAVEDLQGDSSMMMLSQESTNQTTSNAPIPGLNFPILKYLSKGSTKYDSSPISALSFLPIVGACAEAFPAGECWNSSSQNNWHQLSSTDPQREEVIHCHGCSPDDLSMIIYLLSNLLNAHGGPGGDIAIQSWTLLSLTHMTESSAILLQNFSQASAALASLGVAWRCVWTTLFRSDLRYQAYTDGAATDSLGELVLVLLTEMVYWNCTDPITSLVSSPSNRPQSFVHDHQSQVWTLPAFADYRSIKTTSAFELICSMLQKAGLSETGGDSIDVSLARVLFSDQNDSELDSSGMPHHLGRRRRLMCITTGRLESLLRSSVSERGQELYIQRFAAVLSASIVALVNGGGVVQIERTFNARSSPLTTKDDCVLSSFIPFEEMAFNRFQLTCLPLKERVHLDNTTRDSCFRSLWSLPDIRDFALVKPIESVRTHLDCTLSVSSRLRDRLASLDLSGSPSADFISESESDRLRKFLRHFFERRIYGGDGHVLPDGGRTSPLSMADGYNSADSGDEGASKPPCWSTLAMKVALSCSLSHRHDALQQELEHIVMDMSSFLDQTTSNLISMSDQPCDFLRVSSDLMQIMQTLLELSSSYPRINIDRGTVGSVICVCKSFMKGYTYRTRQGSSVHNQTASSTKAESRSMDVVDMLDDDDDDDFDDAPKRGTGDPPEHNVSDESDSDDGLRAKRKRRSFLGSHQETRKRRLISLEKPSAVPPDWLCAQRVATILLILDPCLSNCELVCQTLLGTELDLDPGKAFFAALQLEFRFHRVYILLMPLLFDSNSHNPIRYGY